MSLPICKFYELNQTCRFGNQCRFYHSQRPPPLFKLPPEEDNEASGINVSSQQSDSEVSEPYSIENPESCCTQNDADLTNRNKAEASSITQCQKLQAFPTKVNESGNDFYAHKRICSYFAKGWCRYGRYCKFIHQKVPPRLSESERAKSGRWSSNGSNLVVKETPCFKTGKDSANSKPRDVALDGPNNSSLGEANNTPTGVSTSDQSGNVKQHQRVAKPCLYYRSGGCKNGANCKFLHKNRTRGSQVQCEPVPSDALSSVMAMAKHTVPTQGINAASKPNTSKLQNNMYGNNQKNFISRALKVFDLSELDEARRCKLRADEIEAIKRRFPKDKITYTNDGDHFEANIQFVPSDPDWPFDVKEFTLVVVIPPSYPQQPLNVSLSPDQNLPTTVQRYLEVSIEEWISSKHEQLAQQGKVELLFRPFLRWLDRAIEEVTTEALLQLKRELTAKAAGLEFIPSKKLQAKLFSAGASASEPSGKDDKDEVESHTDEESDDTTEEEDSSAEDEDKDQICSNIQFLELQPQQRGTEVSLKYLQLKENAAAVLFQRLKVILQCSRCKGHTDLHVSPGNVMSLSCNRCNQDMYVTYRPVLLHQFSSVLGYLDVDGCQVFDLVLQDCRAIVSCMACNKQTTIDGIVSGQVIDGWCKACNAKFKIATEAVKMTQLAPSGIDTSSAPVIKSTSSKPKKPPKDPAIREGYPLPDFGTCKHYKQSYRWLRFPCCGKAYPCDVCHDKKEDHEMTLANRMICGHCCKEQNYSSSRPCTSCGEHMTKVRSAHWEGGSGCRDKISMSKGDMQKYKNMNKTVSNKKKMESGHKKKTTKLRHV